MGSFEVANATLARARQAKEKLCSVDGIGSDIDPTIHAWIDGKLVGYARIASEFMAVGLSVPDQFEMITNAAILMRSGWHADEMAVIIESFVPFGEVSDPDVELVTLFARGDLAVRECVTTSYAHADGHQLFLAQPYTYLVGRKIAWDDFDVWTDDDAEEESHFVDVLGRILSSDLVPMEDDYNDQRVVVGENISELGFAVKLAP